MTETAKGLIAMFVACAIWGFSSLYYNALSEVPPMEVLAHRSFWSFVFLLAVLAKQGRVRELWDLCRDRPMIVRVALSAALISVNWFLFIFAVQTGRLVDSSLGYFIYPLLAVLLGAFVLGEKLAPLKWFAVALAGGAVIWLTIGLGATPWIALMLASTFALYGLIKKQISAGPVVSVTGEVFLMLPLVVFWLFAAHVWGWQPIGPQEAGGFGRDTQTTLLLMLAGPMTGGPLLMMSYALKRVSMVSAGLVAYTNPSLQFLLAITVLGEAVTRYHLVAFPIIWFALGIYTWVSFAEERSLRKAARKSETVPTS
ncbi:EamA family transporter RarD [Halocynthiibacter sp. C4]|uniref:EamA family transporter RarD n=1 Tax=Halocynthiibacter sp. C4 TaxID=2992758 RepID=UPI00237C3F66|nr:EamA family transporter RarD [Halocynthiibacter sp. C4]MDE0589943.1 EamA family transporter RarD [Halocynthiibacter sp. C4]